MLVFVLQPMHNYLDLRCLSSLPVSLCADLLRQLPARLFLVEEKTRMPFIYRGGSMHFPLPLHAFYRDCSVAFLSDCRNKVFLSEVEDGSVGR